MIPGTTFYRQSMEGHGVLRYTDGHEKDRIVQFMTTVIVALHVHMVNSQVNSNLKKVNQYLNVHYSFTYNRCRATRPIKRAGADAVTKATLTGAAGRGIVN